MEITYLSHAGYMVESRDRKTRIVIDPWLHGGTYFDQSWLAWSYPGPLDEVQRPDFLLFTHHHKDHFSPLSVSEISRSARVVVPTTAGGFFKEKILELGFAGVHEISADAPLKLGDFEVHSIRVYDQWEFLDETAYLLVEGNRAALLMADLWYLPAGLLRRVCSQFQLCFAAVPWGGSLQDQCVFPEGFRLGSFDEYYNYGMSEASFNERSNVQEFDAYTMVAESVDAGVFTLGGFGFGWIADGMDVVKPLPINKWLDQETFLRELPDSEIRRKSHAMYPGDRFDAETGFKKYPDSTLLNTPVTDSTRRQMEAPKNTAIQLEGKFICDSFLRKIASRIEQLRSATTLYQEQLAHLLGARRDIEFQIVGESRQVFLFEQRGERFSMRELDAPSGAPEVVYLPPTVMASLAADWGPCWTDAEFSGLVKVSASGWAPYTVLRQLFY